MARACARNCARNVLEMFFCILDVLECLFRNGNVLEMCDGEGVCEKCARNVLELWVLPRGCARRVLELC